ncbi:MULTISPECIES: hypothetical protein [Nostocales]|uniref:Bacteriocin n=3 Tax=Nostocales TaxID=1161 RepID=A0A0C1NED1_9CYAN|nr:hypothetical protein [Tolypothrix bouteillei]KAF3887866.1 hypothetical protein DA73_0400022005 [Tolypothrix bouteillei VB521301]
MEAHQTNVPKTAVNISVSKEQKLNNTNFGDWELSDELDDADLEAIRGGFLLNGPLFSIGEINILSGIGSQNGGYNTTSNTQTAYTSVNNTNTNNTNTIGN